MIESKYGLPASSIRKAAFSPELLWPAITGALSDEEWRIQIAEEIDNQFGVPGAADAVAEWALYPGEVDRVTISILDACVSSLKLILVTNATSRLPRNLLALGLSERFYLVVNSSQVGIAKPGKEIFLAALEPCGATPAQALFIDDTVANVDAAAALGIKSHLFIDHQGMSAFLRKANVLRVEIP